MNETRRCFTAKAHFCLLGTVPNNEFAVGRIVSASAARILAARSWRRMSNNRQVVRDSQKQWWDEHPDYQRKRRKANPELMERNRQKQHIRDQKRRLARLARNNLVLDLKHSAAEVCLVGPRCIVLTGTT